MDLWSHKLLLTCFLIIFAVIDETKGDAMVSGSVFCDQCKDGDLSLFDYPISGVKVRLSCANNEMLGEETTNMLGNYVMRFDGKPDLSNCHAQVSGNAQQQGCIVAAGPPQNLTLTFSMFDSEFYVVNSLMTQPLEPMSFCPKSGNNPVAAPTPPYHAPVVPTTPPFHAPVVRTPSPPAYRIPPLPPMPFIEASACPHQSWAMAEYRCYWRGVNPDTKVALVFGPLAARRYGNDMTLWQALQGRGDPYRTLLRESTTALLNSYNSLQFQYNSIDVLARMNSALVGSPRSVLLTALRFIRANSGSPNVPCKFTACK
ncbi:hypothetical protein ACFE04_002229 [Oxalis oulophora]